MRERVNQRSEYEENTKLLELNLYVTIETGA
jgi:hypothetical protein